MKTYTQLVIPINSAWNRKTYNPIVVLRRAIYNKWPNSFLDKNLDKYIFDHYEKIKNGITNLWEWKSVIWKDRHWDDHFIFEVLKHKLILQRKELVEANRHTSIPQTNRDITICLNLIERIQEEFYGMEFMDYEETHFDFIDSDLGPDLKELITNEGPEHLDDYFNLHKATVKKCLKKNRMLIKSKRSLALHVAQENQKKCQVLLFRILNERSNGWWD